MRGGYGRIITLGSSKGGSAAIYYGLLFGASDIYAGACQYYVGQYLKNHTKIFQSMMGKNAGEIEYSILDNVMPDLLKSRNACKSKIHLLYSKEEHTYDEHIKYLIENLKLNDIEFDEQVEKFTVHEEVGRYFIPFIKNALEKI